jgi:hypothetical protein
MARTNTTHERTNATDGRFQDPGKNPRVPDAPTPVDNPNPTTPTYRWLSSDQAFAEFLSSRKEWRVRLEYSVPIQLTLQTAYDQETDKHLAFLRGQNAADAAMERTAA